MFPEQAILKRILKVSHPLLQLYVLKVIKSQIPYSGRKWRQCTYLLAMLDGKADLWSCSKHEGDHSDLPQLPTRPTRRVAHNH